MAFSPYIRTLRPDTLPAVGSPKPVILPSEPKAQTDKSPKSATQALGQSPTLSKSPSEQLSIQDLPSSKSCDTYSLEFLPEPKVELNDFHLDRDEYEVFYINGIMTSEADADAAKDLLVKNLGRPIERLSNPTEGLMNDVRETLDNLNGKPTKVALDAAERLYDRLQSQPNPICIIAHSQGAAITLDALRRVEVRLQEQGLSAEDVQKQMSRFQVVTDGGFSSPEMFPKGVKVQEHRHFTDSIPRLGRAVNGWHESQGILSRTLAGAQALVTVGFTLGVNTGQAGYAFAKQQLGFSSVPPEGSLTGILNDVKSDHTIMGATQGKGYLDDEKNLKQHAQAVDTRPVAAIRMIGYSAQDAQDRLIYNTFGCSTILREFPPRADQSEGMPSPNQTPLVGVCQELYQGISQKQ